MDFQGNAPQTEDHVGRDASVRRLDFSIAAQNVKHEVAFKLRFDGDYTTGETNESAEAADKLAAERKAQYQEEQLRKANQALDFLRSRRKEEAKLVADATASMDMLRKMRHSVQKTISSTLVPMTSAAGSLAGSADDVHTMPSELEQSVGSAAVGRRTSLTLSTFLATDDGPSSEQQPLQREQQQSTAMVRWPGARMVDETVVEEEREKRPRHVEPPKIIVLGSAEVSWADLDEKYTMLPASRYRKRAAKAELAEASKTDESDNAVRVCPTKAVTPSLSRDLDHDFSGVNEDGSVKFPSMNFAPQVQMWEPFVVAAILSLPHYDVYPPEEDDVYNMYRKEEQRKQEKKQLAMAATADLEEEAQEGQTASADAAAKEAAAGVAAEPERPQASWHVRHCIKLLEHTEKSMRRTLPMSIVRIHIGHPALAHKDTKFVSLLDMFLEKKFSPYTFGVQRLMSYILESLFDITCAPDKRTPRTFMVAPYALQLIRNAPGSLFEKQYAEMLETMNLVSISLYNVQEMVDYHANVNVKTQWAQAFEQEPPEMDYEAVRGYTDASMITRRHGGFALGNAEPEPSNTNDMMLRKVGATLEQLMQVQRNDEDEDSVGDAHDMGKVTQKRKRYLIDPEDPCFMPLGFTLTEAFLVIRSMAMALEQQKAKGALAHEGGEPHQYVSKKPMGLTSRDRHVLAAAVLIDLYMREKVDVRAWQLSNFSGLDRDVKQASAKDHHPISHIYRVNAPPDAPLWTTQVLDKVAKMRRPAHWLETYAPSAPDIFARMELPFFIGEDIIWKSLAARGMLKRVPTPQEGKSRAAVAFLRAASTKIVTVARDGLFTRVCRCGRRRQNNDPFGEEPRSCLPGCCKRRKPVQAEEQDKIYEFSQPRRQVRLKGAAATLMEDLNRRREAAKGPNLTAGMRAAREANMDEYGTGSEGSFLSGSRSRSGGSASGSYTASESGSDVTGSDASSGTAASSHSSRRSNTQNAAGGKRRKSRAQGSDRMPAIAEDVESSAPPARARRPEPTHAAMPAANSSAGARPSRSLASTASDDIPGSIYATSSVFASRSPAQGAAAVDLEDAESEEGYFDVTEEFLGARADWWETFKVLYVNAYYLQFDEKTIFFEEEQDMVLWRAQLLMFFFALQALFEVAFESSNGLEVVLQTFCPPFAKLPLWAPKGLEGPGGVIRGLANRALLLAEGRANAGVGGVAVEAGEFQERNRDLITKELFSSPDLANAFDKDGSGEVTLLEFIAGLSSLPARMRTNVFDGMPTEALGAMIEDLAVELFAELDYDGNGSLTSTELAEAVDKRRREVEAALARDNVITRVLKQQWQDFQRSIPGTDAHRRFQALEKVRMARIRREYEALVHERLKTYEMQRRIVNSYNTQAEEEEE